VTVGGLQYDVTTFTGTYDSNTSSFATAANNGVMPWWSAVGNNATAVDFATAVGNGLGGPNSGDGPFFAFGVFGGSNIGVAFSQPDSSVVTLPVGSSLTVFYAQATLYTAPAASAPGPLPLFGAAAAFGFSRKLRKRIQGARLPIGSCQPRA
jgi:hypothetical protein